MAGDAVAQSAAAAVRAIAPAEQPRGQALRALGARTLELAEMAFVVGSFILISDALSTLLNPSYGDAAGTVADSASAIGLVLGKLFWLGTAVLTLRHPLRAARAAWRSKAMLLYTAITLLSFRWAVVPGAALHGAMWLLWVTCFGWYLAGRFEPEQILALLATSLAVTAFLSAGVVLVAPSIGFRGDQGGWRGVFPHKNTLGMFMALAVAAWVFDRADARRGRWFAIGVVSMALGLLFLSGSTTAAVGLVAAGGMTLLYRTFRWDYRASVPLALAAAVLAACALIVAVGYREATTSIVGKDATLTGRTELWAALLPSLRARLWLGYGVDSFWRGPIGESGLVGRLLRWQPAHAHNGFLDVALATGLLGLLTLVAAYAGAVWTAFQRARRTTTAVGLWPMAFLTFLLFYNLTESNLVRNAVLWTLFVTIACAPPLPAGERTGAPRPGLPGGVSPGVRAMLRRNRRSGAPGTR